MSYLLWKFTTASYFFTDPFCYVNKKVKLAQLIMFCSAKTTFDLFDWQRKELYIEQM